LAEYGKVFKKIWNNNKFRNLSDDGKLLWFYIITSPHLTLIGMYVIDKYYISGDIKWLPERLEKPFQELLGGGFIKYDDSSRTLLIPSWFEHNKIGNDNQLIKALAELSELPNTILLNDLKDAIKGLPKGFGKGLQERLLKALPKGLPNSVSVSVSNTVTIKEDPEAENPENPQPPDTPPISPTADFNKIKDNGILNPDNEKIAESWIDMVNDEQVKAWKKIELTVPQIYKLLNNGNSGKEAGFQTFDALICAIRASGVPDTPFAYLYSISRNGKDVEKYRKRGEKEVTPPPGVKRWGHLLKKVNQDTSSG
jgi:hypothetical protein